MDKLLQVQDLVKYYPVKNRNLFGKTQHLKAVDGVSFDIKQASTLGIVGESGCGKSTLGKAILMLEKANSGNVWFKNRNIFTLNPSELQSLRKEMQLIFQDPFSSLNPRMKVKELVVEPLELHKIGTRKSRNAAAMEMLKKVGIDADAFSKYPHEFSGGQRQRIGIARALILNPRFVLCDEAVSALDVSIQSQIINLLFQLQKEMGLTYMFISHDLSVIKHICNRVAVMYLGKIVEIGDVKDVFNHPAHPYTRALLSANLSLNPNTKQKRIILKGEIPSALNLPSGCRFHTRCQDKKQTCRNEEPRLIHLGNEHLVACQLHN